MDCDLARIQSRVCFSKIKEIVKFLRSLYRISQAKLRSWFVKIRLSMNTFLNLNFKPMVWGYYYIFTNIEGPYSPLMG